MKPLIPIVVAAAAPALAFTNPAPLEFGVFCHMGANERQEAPDTVMGAINLTPNGNEIRWPQAQVPMAIGIGFGLWFDAGTMHPGGFTTEVLHPPMGPGRVKRESWQSFHSTQPGNERRYVGYSLEQPQELVPGVWRFRIVQGDDIIVEQQFTLVPPSQFPTIVATCQGKVLSS